MSETKTPAIYGAMVSILSSMESIPKDRKAADGGIKYAYRGIDDALTALNPLLASHKVFVVPMVEGSERFTGQYRNGGTAYGVSIRVRYRFYSAEDGSFVDAIVQGDGLDAGEKGVYKALSGAFKYAIFQTFCIPTEEPKDPETQHHDVAPPRAASAPRRAAPAKGKQPRSRTPVGATGVIFPFGKSKGLDLAEVPTEALLWATNEGPWKEGCEDDPKYGEKNAKQRDAALRVLSQRGDALDDGSDVPGEEDQWEGFDPSSVPF